MQLILTHEQADFDAMGALLGAALMNEHAYPVLPRRTNRNVRAFLALYGAELPFIEPADLPSEAIELVTLVDTQSLVTLKGMGAHTHVQAVDHHARRAEIPAGWTVTTEAVGACTTLFVEGLREHNGMISPLQATLLLLGIYEDTGSLTYANTTARDATAVAYLLEHNASLQLAAQYLNPALTPLQRQLYDRLLTSAENIQVHGQSIIVSTASGVEQIDEISSVAHKIRDLLDPAGLFILVRTTEGLRLVGRSTNDQVDVAGAAAHFGGGGHNRAAAALIHISSTELLPYQKPGEDPLKAVRRELMRILPDHIRPSTTVRQIMSRHPLLLSPDTPAEEAAQLMQRYGYEGYPIVRDGKVIGLLNRRAVDRSVSHRLNLPAASLMEAGEVTVRTDDSLEQLRDVMIHSGWGQIPVVDPKTGTVVGIVTRTDLLKNITGSVPLPGRSSLASRLDAALPPARLALLKAIAGEARDLHQAIYIVGGFVRDLLLDRPSLDFDLVVEGDAILLANRLKDEFGGRVVTHGRFGTAKWNIDGERVRLAEQLQGDDENINPSDLPENLDLISARTEFYDYPTALPTVERSSIKLDLHRRDFTFNTMALRLDGSHYGDLYDYWGGMRDLREGRVRVLHSLSFVDDPTRQLRAVRFEQRFGFHIEARTLQLMEEARPLITKVSGDRLRHELNLLLGEDHAPAMLARLKELDLLSAIHPDLTWQPDLAGPLETALHAPLNPAWNLPNSLGSQSVRLGLAYLVWMLTLPTACSQAVATRLHLPGSLNASLEQAHLLWQERVVLGSLSPSQLTARLDAVSTLALAAVSILNDEPTTAQQIEAYLTHWKALMPYTRGEDLRARGITPGPAYKEILAVLRSAWLEGTLHSAAEEEALLAELLKAHPEWKS